jgi:uncharacterized protein YdaU (DUF1376 family)
MAQFPGLTIWTDAWVADTFHLTHEEIGIYIRLLVLMWRTPGCQVPNDDLWLAKHMRMPPQEVAEKLRPIIVELCQSDANCVYQKRLKREFVLRFELGARQSARAKSRWRKKKDAYSGNAASGNAASGNPSLPYRTLREEPSFFPTAATPTVAEKPQPNGSARSLASAPNGGALTREPPTEPAELKRALDKPPADRTLADVNVLQKYGY